jgi:hypothetical protein
MKLFESTSIPYIEMSSKEQENVNVTNLINILAKRGIEGIRINNDKHCADIVAHDPSTGQNTNIQVKGNRRVVVSSKYKNRSVWIATFIPDRNEFFLFDHDLALDSMKSSLRYMKKGQDGTSILAGDPLLDFLVKEAQGQFFV